MTAPAEKPARWPQPGELWSLWDMLELLLGEAIDANNSVTTMMQALQTLTQLKVDRRGMLGSGSLGDLLAAATTIEKISKRADLDATMESAIRLREQLEKLRDAKQANGNVWHENDLDVVQECATHLKVTFADQVRSRLAVLLTPSEAEQYAPKEPLFGTDFATKFHRADYDVAEAGKCLALGRSTAAAFHSMRVAELGVRALANCLGIPDPTKPAEKNWGIVLGAIKKDGLDAKWPKAADRMSGDGAELEALYASLDAMKNPWRNETMHVERAYQPYEAKEVFDATRAFMRRLAKRMDQDGNPKA